MEELVSQLTHQPPVAKGRTEPAAAALLKSQWLLKPKRRRLLKLDLSTSLAIFPE
jgi:hypothetical protein